MEKLCPFTARTVSDGEEDKYIVTTGNVMYNNQTFNSLEEAEEWATHLNQSTDWDAVVAVLTVLTNKNKEK